MNQRLRRRCAPVITLVMLAAACSGTAADTSSVLATSAAPGQGPAAPFRCQAQSGGTAAGSFIDQIESTPREEVPSALANSNDSSFPQPLIALEEIRSGGPPPDGIPPIDNPRFVPATEVDFVADCEVVLAIELAGEARAYPVQIMTWHEIVNDTIGDTPVTVAYCPLCNSALAYDRRLGERILDFGTSGNLYNSSLIMYDRQTESLWTHFTGEAVVGHLAGERLDLLPVQTLAFGAFVNQHPDGLVLTRTTGHQRNYGANPYTNYDVEGGGEANLFDGDVPDTYRETTRVIGIDHNEDKLAVLHDLAFTRNVVPVEVGGESLVVLVEPGAASPLEAGAITGGRDVGSSGVFVAQANGIDLTFEWTDGRFVDTETGSTWSIDGTATGGPMVGERLAPVIHLDTFWFSWLAFHPETEVLD